MTTSTGRRAAPITGATGPRRTERATATILEVSLRTPGDAEPLLARLEIQLAREQPFGLLIRGAADLAHACRLIAAVPAARARLRRLRPALGTWCAGAAHVVDPHDLARESWPGEVLWGCAAATLASDAEAIAWLAEQLRR